MNENINLHKAKKAKADEFYTQYADIETEMNAYIEYNKDVFKNKIILCPCDDPEWSNFTKYFAANFERLGLKQLISTSYAKSSGNKQISKFEKNSNKFNEEMHKTHGKVFILDKDKNNSGKIDYEDIEFEYLQGDGDFRSDEVTKLRDKADVIITNPPFSLFREFLAWIIEAEKEFVIIGNQNTITHKDIFPLIRDNKIWLGNGFKGNAGFFKSPYDDIATAGEHREGLIRVPGVLWFTNIDHGKRHEPLQLMTMEDNLKYNKKLKKKLEENWGNIKYPHYDNYDAIEIPLYNAIPSDYNGIMAVPITFLYKHCPEQFEIVGCTYNYGIPKEWSSETKMNSLVEGKSVYKRLLIKKKGK